MSTSIKLQTEVCIPVSCNLHLHQSQQLLADFDLSRVSAMYTCGASPGRPNNVRNCCRSLTNYSCPDEQIVTRGNNLTSWQNRCKDFHFYTLVAKTSVAKATLLSQMSVHPSVSLSPKPLRQLSSFIKLMNFLSIKPVSQMNNWIELSFTSVSGCDVFSCRL